MSVEQWGDAALYLGALEILCQVLAIYENVYIRCKPKVENARMIKQIKDNQFEMYVGGMGVKCFH